MYISEVLKMKRNRVFMGIVILSMCLFISACTPANQPDDKVDNDNKLEEEIQQKDKRIAELEIQLKELEKDSESKEAQHLITKVVSALQSLKEKDMEGLQEYIHPEKGLRFTAYPNVDLDKDIVLKRDEIVSAYNDSKTYNWGKYDGKGSPIELSFKDYYEEFVYDEDFLNPQIIGNNRIVSGGNTIDNVKEAYPDGRFVELYFEVFKEEYRGMDWKSLKLVFEQYDSKWYLVGIIHGEWTI